jgi:iron complex transport system substrate-binding protein
MSRFLRIIIPVALTLGVAAMLEYYRPQRVAAKKATPAAPAFPQRIICTSPGIAEMVFALCEPNRIVGVSDFCNYPLAAKETARIGGCLNPNRERILALKPDLVISQGRAEKLGDLCERMKIRHCSLEIDTVKDVLAAIAQLGQELGCEDRAADLTQQIQQEFDDVRRRVAGRPPVKVFLSIGHTPGNLAALITPGPQTFLSELLVMAGGENIFADAKGYYPQISKEALLRRQPQLILEAFPEGLTEPQRQRLLQDWQQMAGLNALRDNKLTFVTDEFLLIPGVRIGQSVRRLAELIHPEAYHD